LKGSDLYSFSMKTASNQLESTENKFNFGHRVFDRLGVFLSILCGIHCLLTPFILISAPWLGNILGNESFHVLMLALVIPVAVLSVIQNNGLKGPTVKIMLSGIFLLVLGVLVHFTHHSHGGDHHLEDFILENLFTISGGGFLFFAHMKKLKNCRCPHSH